MSDFLTLTPVRSSAFPFRYSDCCGCGLETPVILLLPNRVGGGNYPVCDDCYHHGKHLRACAGCGDLYPERALSAGLHLCAACVRGEEE